MDATNPRKSPQRRLAGSRAVFVYVLVCTIFGLGFLSIGSGAPLLDRAISVLFVVLNSAWIPMIYLLGALGLGRIARHWTSPLPTRWVIELGIGLTLTLSFSHGLGVLGWLNPVSAWIVTGIGSLLLMRDFKEYAPVLNHSIGRTSVSIAGMVFVMGCALVVLMSLNPMGTLWDSEFGGYDALSYHLELPREWLEIGHITPVEHNVYSFLPSYFESAYLHFAYLVNAPATTTIPTTTGLSGLLPNNAQIAMSTQLFSAILVIISAIAMRSLARRAIELYLPNHNPMSRSPALCARVLMVCTPWITIVGSLAYNEMGIVLLGISAIALAIEAGTSDTFRSIAIALMVGGACSVKPTALFLLAPSVGVVFLSTIPPSRWLKPLILGSLVGLLTLSPWLIRNQIATGNMVFPMLSGIFGDGHWSPAQHIIYANAHHFEGSLLERFLMLLVPDDSGEHHISRFRGFTNVQWAITPWIGLLGCLMLLAQKPTRRLGLVLILAIALPEIAWMTLTHLQSRFLIPMVPILIIAGVLGIASIPAQRIVASMVSLISLVAFGLTALIASNQSGGNPFMLIDLGPGVFTGQSAIGNPPWSATLNSITEPDETIYLLGDATGFYIRSPMVYNTVYDRWLIEDAINTHPDDPSRWTPFLQSKGIDLIVISFSEINRFAQSRWLPESIDPIQLAEWIKSLPEPIYIWTHPTTHEPIRAAFRISPEH